MSADNFVGVTRMPDGTFVVHDGNASMDSEDCLYIGRKVFSHDTREAALVVAHDYAKTLPVLEYGVTESVLPTEPCGRCFTCINERNLPAPENLSICCYCNKPIYDWEWRTMQGGKTYHSSCEPIHKRG